MATYNKYTKLVKERLTNYPDATLGAIDEALKGKRKTQDEFYETVMLTKSDIENAERSNIAVETKTEPKAKKALVPKKTNTKPLSSIKKRSNFDQVAAGICPHDSAKLGDEIRGRGVGVTRICKKCEHRWYLNRKIKTSKCITCSTNKRKEG